MFLIKTALISIITLITTFAMASSAQGFDLIKSFVSNLDAAQEVTPSPSDATGFATLDLLGNDMGDYQLKYKITVTLPLNFTDISTLPGNPVIGNDNVTKIHLHAGAPRGLNGVLPFNIRTISDVDGSLLSNIDDDFMISVMDEITIILGLLEEDEFTPVSEFPTFQSLIAELLATPDGEDTSLYWNIHTAGLPSGAIRGQV